jgi:hypothetical protein
MRLVLRQGIEPRRYAFGAAAALALLDPFTLEDAHGVSEMVRPLWDQDNPDPYEATAAIEWIETACQQLSEWKQSAGFPDLTSIML